jgi:hypothetical protein
MRYVSWSKERGFYFSAGGSYVRRQDYETGQQELAAALEKLLRAYDSLMPGLAHIAVQDYALINEAPLEARRAIQKAKKQ